MNSLSQSMSIIDPKNYEKVFVKGVSKIATNRVLPLEPEISNLNNSGSFAQRALLKTKKEKILNEEIESIKNEIDAIK